jgi:Holliday junction resolvasome RuvABC endonuclease subunit
MFADANDLKLVEYRPKAIKKYWTRNGNADKKQMVARTQSFGYIDVKDHNESDAIAMLYFHLKGVK